MMCPGGFDLLVESVMITRHGRLTRPTSVNQFFNMMLIMMDPSSFVVDVLIPALNNIKS